MLELGVKFLLSYFIGSVMGAMVVGKLRGGVDIRNMGSGNAGGTNALRTQGLLFALGVVVIDIGKGVIGAGVVPGLDLPFVAEDPGVSRTWLQLSCAIAAIFGHVWPIYHAFRGGKGAATFIGTLLVLGPMLIAPVLAVWFFILTLSGFVGLATMSAVVSLPVYVAITRLPEDQPLLIFCMVVAAFIVYWHRSNIARMRAGNENRNERVMLFHRRGTSDDEPH